MDGGGNCCSLEATVVVPGGTQRCIIRTVITADQIIGLSDQIVSAFAPEKVILFGSYAYGTPTEDSDVDLLVVMACAGSELVQSAKIRCAIDPTIAIDLLVRRPRTIRQRLEWGDDFLLEIFAKGITLHEEADARMGREGRRRLRYRLTRNASAKVAKL